MLVAFLVTSIWEGLFLVTSRQLFFSARARGAGDMLVTPL